MSPFSVAQEESLASYFYRRALISGSKMSSESSKHFFSLLSGKFKVLPALGGKNLDLKIAIPSFGQVARLSEQNSLLPMLRPVSKPQLQSQLYTTLMGQFTHMKGVSNSYDYNLGNPSLPEVVFCPDCFRENIETYGMPWFKREWQIFSFGYCLQHNRKLTNVLCYSCNWKPTGKKWMEFIFSGFCPKCKQGIWLKDSCESLSPSDEHKKVIVWFQQILQAEIPYLSPPLRKQLIVIAMRKSGCDPLSDIRCQIEHILRRVSNANRNHLYVSMYSAPWQVLQMIERGECIGGIELFWLIMMVAFKKMESFIDVLFSIGIQVELDCSKFVGMEANSEAGITKALVTR